MSSPGGPSATIVPSAIGGGQKTPEGVLAPRPPHWTSQCYPCSGRGWCNLCTLTAITGVILFLFLIYPILLATIWAPLDPVPPGRPPIRAPVDPDTPAAAHVWTSPATRRDYQLVFSDEFNADWRSFRPGHDPYFEAMDLHYWQTGDYERYRPSQVDTRNGSMRIKVDRRPANGLKYQSGMVQTWNRFCFRGGYLETNVSLPGSPYISGFWSSFWMLGNLGRAGYGASTEGLWPYSYTACDKGAEPAQGLPWLSMLKHGQRLSSCVCHPNETPSLSLGRAAPELDLFEAASSPNWGATVSQSHQFAPFDMHYTPNYTHTHIYDTSRTGINSYKGGPYQQSVSAVTRVSPRAFEAGGWATFGVEYEPGANGWVVWYVDGRPTFRLDAAAVAPNPASGVSQRLIADEPMYLIINLGMSDSFSWVDHARLGFPATMYIDRVRVYQESGRVNVGCDPDDRPTAKYISEHARAYQVWNYTSWEGAGYSWPERSVPRQCAEEDG